MRSSTLRVVIPFLHNIIQLLRLFHTLANVLKENAHHHLYLYQDQQTIHQVEGVYPCAK